MAPVAPIRTLDEFEFDDVDFIKIDTEGYETFVIKGAMETLMRCKPVIVVEQKGGNELYGIQGEAPAVAMLEAMGFKLKDRVRDDYILAWP